MKKLARITEILWLVLAVGTAIMAVWKIAEVGFQQGRLWLFFPAITLAMFFFRRFMRRKLEAMEERTRQEDR